ncbi:carbohydrate ABC transporter permease [Paenibacillus sepulcri]|uniref:Carbohydrate ABC transporter permease n=2 Tax=Paenibacillus sepulcri TaxID=359917 RepID=A0ABS7C726_9BACL|nr:carbohydrate ABC transporter permease [Paenibacillus sepulcri]
MSDRLFRLINGGLLGLMALLTFFPIYYVVVISFTDSTELLAKDYILFPSKWSFDAYSYLLSTDAFLRSLGNSAFLAVVGTVCSLAVTSSFAYALSRKKLMGRRLLMLLTLLTILFSPGIIPNFILIRQLGLLDSLWSLILPAMATGWNILLMKNFFDSLPQELGESAAIDGCGETRAWVSIMLPLSLPALAAFGLFYAVGFWNQFFTALLYLNDSSRWPIQVLLQNMLLNASNTDLAVPGEFVEVPPSESLKMAAVVVAIAPIVMVYPFLQKHFAKGAMVGSIKG